jgi:hypothetical protein
MTFLTDKVKQNQVLVMNQFKKNEEKERKIVFEDNTCAGDFVYNLQRLYYYVHKNKELPIVDKTKK